MSSLQERVVEKNRSFGVAGDEKGKEHVDRTERKVTTFVQHLTRQNTEMLDRSSPSDADQAAWEKDVRRRYSQVCVNKFFWLTRYVDCFLFVSIDSCHCNSTISERKRPESNGTEEAQKSMHTCKNKKAFTCSNQPQHSNYSSNAVR